MSTDRSLDRRANAVAGAVVATVVLLLGFGTGIGAVVTSRSASKATPSDAGVAGAPSVTAAAGSPAPPMAGTSTATTGAVALPAVDPTTAAARTTPAVGRVPARGTAASAPADGPGSGCADQFLLDAMAEPFLVHLGKAHLEESPGQQVGGLLNLDQYVKTHTVLAGSMVGPALDTAMALQGGLDPFVAHVNKAHLEESPGQQAADLLDVDQYVKTHTVLVGSMTAPAITAAMDAGC